jgi:hypothetical protein
MRRTHDGRVGRGGERGGEVGGRMVGALDRPNIVDITSYGGWLHYVAAKKADAGGAA